MAKKRIKHKDITLKKILTGIEGFNIITEGGLPRGRATLISGTSGSGKTLFSLEFLWHGMTRFKENGVFVTFEETPRDICNNVKSLGWDLEAMQEAGKLAFVDASPIAEDKEPTGKYDLGALVGGQFEFRCF